MQRNRLFKIAFGALLISRKVSPRIEAVTTKKPMSVLGTEMGATTRARVRSDAATVTDEWPHDLPGHPPPGFSFPRRLCCGPGYHGFESMPCTLHPSRYTQAAYACSAQRIKERGITSCFLEAEWAGLRDAGPVGSDT
jgi:hypothetical protein